MSSSESTKNTETMELAKGEDQSGKDQEEPETTSASTQEGKKDETKAESVESSHTGAGDGEDQSGKDQEEHETTSASTQEGKKDETKAESVESSQHTNTGAGGGDREDHTEKNQKVPETICASTQEDEKDGSSTESVGSSQHTNTGAGGGEERLGKDKEEPKTTSASTQEDKKVETKAESVESSQHTKTGAGHGEDHAEKNQNEPEIISASTHEDKKDETNEEAVGSSQHTNTGAGHGEHHADKNQRESETTSALAQEDKKDETKAESDGSSQHTNTEAGGGEDSTHGNQEKLETTDGQCLGMKKDVKHEADVRAGQSESGQKDEFSAGTVGSSQHANTGAGDKEHHAWNQEEPEATSASAQEDKKDESKAESVGFSERKHTGAGDADHVRQRKPKNDEEQKIENIAHTTKETTESTVQQSTSHKGALIILAFVALVAFPVLYNYYISHQSDSPPERDDVSIKFSRQMDKVENRFRNQEPEFWRRTRIHLQRHLQTAQPTEPVSVILTAGLRAEKTLDCLARDLATAFSSAFNSSSLHIDGARKASQDSDQVKLDIDRKLQRAFEGGKRTAVIHRFEELPPGSTLIFYRYCDHENAAYKETFLIFTVLLEEEEEITANIRLSALEEMVDDYLKKKFLSDSSPVSYDRMDLDKYGGLWSRISHLILPVAADERIEHAGCQGT